MKKLSSALLGLLLSMSVYVKADEGMWLPILIEKNMATMTEMGLKLTAEDIYSINQASIKDAIVALDYGSCTAELISGEGLLLTNHHCGYGEIQAHSSVEHDYLTDGFWAMSKKDELVNPNKRASFLVRVEDITSRVLSAIPANADETLRNHLVDSVSTVVSNEATKDSHFEAEIAGMFFGNYYYLFVYEVFMDIRLVGAPPESIGKYGADTDNWMWPRHTADFSLFRIYSGPDGKPAKYSEENIPYKSKHFLPISLDGVKKDDFAFIMGYPGSTTHYMTSWEVKNEMEVSNANRIKIRGVKQDIWKEFMDNSDAVRIKYSSKFARSSNYWKYSIGQNKGLQRLNVIGKKQQQEAEFTQWINSSETLKAKYEKALPQIEKAIMERRDYEYALQYLVETQWGGAEIFRFAFGASALQAALGTPDSTQLITEAVEKFKKNALRFYKDYDAATDKKATSALIKLYLNDVKPEFYPEYINTVLVKKYKNNVDKFVDDLFQKSIFTDSSRLYAFLAKPNAKIMGKDLAFISGVSIRGQLVSLSANAEPQYLKVEEGMRLFVAGLIEMKPEKAFAPDANSTMRLTYGTVGDYSPADAVQYSYFTTLDGVMEKEDSTVREFNIPAKLKDIYKRKDYGPYGNADGTMSVCFTTNNDITGGNSGSPVMNAKGQLIGAAFDGNWEAMSGDIAFEPKLQKTIVVDIRYVMLIIDKFAGAQNLIDEMNLVKTQQQLPLPIDGMKN
jgi:hypothetical protein